MESAVLESFSSDVAGLKEPLEPSRLQRQDDGLKLSLTNAAYGQAKLFFGTGQQSHRRGQRARPTLASAGSA